MAASDVIERFKSLGYSLQIRHDGKLVVTPCPPSDEAPRLAPLARLVQQHRDEVIRLLQSERPDMSVTAEYVDAASTSNTPDMSAALPLNLVRIANAVAANPRSPILTDMALAVFVRHVMEAQRTIERLPAAAKAEALARCREVEDRIVAAITGRDYQEAYTLAAALPDELCTLTAQ
jgi:hypothetical protein